MFEMSGIVVHFVVTIYIPWYMLLLSGSIACAVRNVTLAMKATSDELERTTTHNDDEKEKLRLLEGVAKGYT